MNQVIELLETSVEIWTSDGISDPEQREQQYSTWVDETLLKDEKVIEWIQVMLEKGLVGLSRDQVMGFIQRAFVAFVRLKTKQMRRRTSTTIKEESTQSPSCTHTAPKRTKHQQILNSVMATPRIRSVSRTPNISPKDASTSRQPFLPFPRFPSNPSPQNPTAHHDILPPFVISCLNNWLHTKTITIEGISKWIEYTRNETISSSSVNHIEIDPPNLFTSTPESLVNDGGIGMKLDIVTESLFSMENLGGEYVSKAVELAGTTMQAEPHEVTVLSGLQHTQLAEVTPSNLQASSDTNSFIDDSVDLTATSSMSISSFHSPPAIDQHPSLHPTSNKPFAQTTLPKSEIFMTTVTKQSSSNLANSPQPPTVNQTPTSMSKRKRRNRAEDNEEWRPDDNMSDDESDINENGKDIPLRRSVCEIISQNTSVQVIPKLPIKFPSNNNRPQIPQSYSSNILPTISGAVNNSILQQLSHHPDIGESWDDLRFGIAIKQISVGGKTGKPKAARKWARNDIIKRKMSRTTDAEDLECTPPKEDVLEEPDVTGMSEENRENTLRAYRMYNSLH